MVADGHEAPLVKVRVGVSGQKLQLLLVEGHLADGLVDVFVAKGVGPALAVVALRRQLVGRERRIVDRVVHVHLRQVLHPVFQLLNLPFVFLFLLSQLLKGLVKFFLELGFFFD